MNLFNSILLSLILVVPAGLSTTLILLQHDDQEFEILRSIGSEEEDERGSDEMGKKSQLSFTSVVNLDGPDDQLLISNRGITYRNRLFNSLKPDVLTPPPKQS